ncbi:hypothetical protein Calab_2176 [Caldithrix abyssi DSM 13497]|uniref:Uncharacterized protein n=1 Tax=Caldithrix abyssi DSM 13497 TaxID=880073 RepID=H1XW14_CALAY|nr:hypothetical protein Calab_2176 [Caldithrix abyssi DSM 13497]
MAVQSDGIEYESGVICLPIHSGAEFYFWGCLKSQRHCIFIKFFFPSPPLIPPLPKIGRGGKGVRAIVKLSLFLHIYTLDVAFETPSSHAHL